MNVGDVVTVNSGEPSWDGLVTVEEVQPPVTTEEWIYVRYSDGREGWVPSKYATETV